jgi:hypothetical protein
MLLANVLPLFKRGRHKGTTQAPFLSTAHRRDPLATWYQAPAGGFDSEDV